MTRTEHSTPTIRHQQTRRRTLSSLLGFSPKSWHCGPIISATFEIKMTGSGCPLVRLALSLPLLSQAIAQQLPSVDLGYQIYRANSLNVCSEFQAAGYIYLF